MVPFEEATGMPRSSTPALLTGKQRSTCRSLLATRLTSRASRSQESSLTSPAKAVLCFRTSRRARSTQADWAQSQIELRSCRRRVLRRSRQERPQVIVWYKPAVFEAGGYDIPQTWDELKALTDTMIADGNTPWCVGIESGQATGWTFTDWTEDLMLRYHGGEAYDQWVATNSSSRATKSRGLPRDPRPVEHPWCSLRSRWFDQLDSLRLEPCRRPRCRRLCHGSPGIVLRRLLARRCF